jgi:hypothetical protein
MKELEKLIMAVISHLHALTVLPLEKNPPVLKPGLTADWSSVIK